MDKNAVLLSYDLLPILEDLLQNGNAQAAAEITVAMIKYDKDGEEPVFANSMVAFVWRTVIKPKLDEYKRKYDERAKRNRENGANGGRPKKQEVINEANGINETQKTQSVIENQKNPVGLEKSKQTSIDKIRIDKIREDKESKEKEKKKEKEDFELFWAEYPKHKGKVEAVKAFEKAIKKTDIDTLLNAVRAQKTCTQWVKDGGMFIPYPATWLNQERWSDELDSYVAKSYYSSPNSKNDIQSGLAMALDLIQGSEDG